MDLERDVKCYLFLLVNYALHDFFALSRMMLPGVLSTMLTLLKVWMQSKRLLFLFPWTHSKVMFLRSLLELLG